MAKRVLIAGAMMLAASPVAANWQFSRWGMTPTEVIQSSGGTAHAGDGAASAQQDGSTSDVAGTYEAGGRTFTSMFYFQAGRLVSVVLETRNAPDCVATEHDLEAVYGAPAERTKGVADTWLWLDRQKDNRVKMIIVSGLYCELQYSPLASAAASKL